MIQHGGENTNGDEFQRRFFYELLRDCYRFQENNIDFLRFGIGNSARARRKIKDRVLAFLEARGFIRKPFNLDRPSQQLVSTVSQMDGLARTFSLLRDNYSRQLLLDLLRFRILGARHVKLPSNDTQYWADYNSIDRRYLKERRTVKTGWGWDLNLYELSGSTGLLKLHVTPLGILNTFLREQYAYQKTDPHICVKEGDIVIDGGGCWGDTALYFADRVGSRGKVYCFEFDQENTSILQQNLALNPLVAGGVKIIPKALWDRSGELVNYCANGPATSLTSQQPFQSTSQVPTMAIDDLVKEEKLARVDYIKMDIEGSELKALRGAEETLRSFRPSLAISLYHNDDDFVTIPDYLHGLGLQYEFFLDHFTIHCEETVLFARTKSK